MQRYFSKLAVILTLGFVLLSPILVLAADPVGTVTLPNPLNTDSFATLLDRIINIIFTISLAIAPIMIIVAGFYYVTAMGDMEKVKVAHKIILWTLIGLLVVICSKGIITFFQQAVGVTQTSTPTVPNE